MTEDIDYKVVADMLQRENEALKIRIAEGLHMGHVSWSPDFGKMRRFLSDPMHLYAIFIALCIVATSMQCVQLWKDIRR